MAALRRSEAATAGAAGAVGAATAAADPNFEIAREGPQSGTHSINNDPPPQERRRKMKKQHPQHSVDEFWDKFTTKHPGKIFTLLPDNLYAKRAAIHAPKGATPGQNAIASYEHAVASCKAKVAKISKDCRRINQKYRDPHFDIEADFKRSRQLPNIPPDCLTGLADGRTTLQPQSVKRVEDIFDAPQFFIKGATANDVRQGNDGDCWFMSALCTLTNKPGLIENICVARDEQVGVYGFVFHRDGEWISEVIDDKLYLIKEDFDEATLGRHQWLELQNRKSPEEEYRTVMQCGSRALYFAQCSDPNETWLPLLEKAYAKAHGDYAAIDGGFVGEGIEDLTGGVTTEMFATDILDKDKFWKEELMNVNKDFLFGCGQMGGIYGQRNGIQEKHAYSIMEAREIDGKRLLKLRNPWGKTEWTGPWSDGSEEWTPEWMHKLNHTFGNDGVFWISYKDLLRHYQHFDRTRLFGPEWNVTQQWSSVNVPWSVDYLDTKFKVSLSQGGPVVIVLSQLDDRYFNGLEGQYDFQMQFRVHKDDEDDYIVRSNGNYYMKRSVGVELDLEAGNYTVLLKITATRFDRPLPEELIRDTCRTRREKLLAIGLSYDLAHAKGQFRERERQQRREERAERVREEKIALKKDHERMHRERKKAKLKAKRRQERLAEKRGDKRAVRPGQGTPGEDQDAASDTGLGIMVNGDDVASDQHSVKDEDSRIVHVHHAKSASTGTARIISRDRSESETGGFRGRGGYNKGRGGYNEATDLSESPVPVPSSTPIPGYSRRPLTERSDSPGPSIQIDLVSQQRRSDSPGPGFGGRGGYNKPQNCFQGRGGYNESAYTGRGGYNDAGYTGRGGYNDAGFTGRGGYNDTAYTGRGGYNESGDGEGSLPQQTPSSQPNRNRRDTVGASPAPSRRATLSPHPEGHRPLIRVNSGNSIAASMVSDVEDADFSWDSDIDGPDDFTDSDSDENGSFSARRHHHVPATTHRGRRILGAMVVDDVADDDSEDEFEADPWNAVCVLGLRVYSKDTNVAIEVVRPKSDALLTAEEKRQKDLDVDDSARDATKQYEGASQQGDGTEFEEIGNGVAELELDKSG